MLDHQQKFGESTTVLGTSDLASELFGMPAVEVPGSARPTTQSTRAVQLAARPLPPRILQSMLLEHQRIEALSRRHNLPVRPIGIAPVFEEVRIYQGLDSKWVLSPVENDVFYRYYGNKLPVPKWVKSEINRAVALGIDPRAYIAHELPREADDLKPGQAIPIEWVLPPPPAALARRTKMLAGAGCSWWQGVRAVLKGTAVAGRAVTAGTVAIGAAAVGGVMAVPLALACGVDPCLLGAYCDDSWTVDGRPVATWYYISHWYSPE